MKGPDRARETETSFLGSIRGIRSLIRLAPLVALALTLAGTGCKSEVDADLQKCREEVARLEGILLRKGVEPELVDFGKEDSGDSAKELLLDCKVRTSRLEALRGHSPPPNPSLPPSMYYNPPPSPSPYPPGYLTPTPGPSPEPTAPSTDQEDVGYHKLRDELFPVNAETNITYTVDDYKALGIEPADIFLNEVTDKYYTPQEIKAFLSQ